VPDEGATSQAAHEGHKTTKVLDRRAEGNRRVSMDRSTCSVLGNTQFQLSDSLDFKTEISG